MTFGDDVMIVRPGAKSQLRIARVSVNAGFGLLDVGASA